MSVLRPRLLRQDGVCLARVLDLYQHVQRATVHAQGDRECRGLLCVALQLGLLNAATASPDLMHRQEPAGRLVDVHEAVCADSVLVHQPAQLHEEPVLVGVLLHALGGLLVAQAHAIQESLPQQQLGLTSSPSASSQSYAEPLIVTALGHRTSVTPMMCSLSRVMSAGDSKVSLPSGASAGALRFQR